MYLELCFDLGALDPQSAEAACWVCGARAVTFLDARDDPVLEPAPAEFRLWPRTRLQCLFMPGSDAAGLARALGAALGIDPGLIEARELEDRLWEREWLRDSHARRFGRRLWVSPQHEKVGAPGAVVVTLDPGLAFGTGTHPSTALCLEWLDAHFSGSPASAEHSGATRPRGLDAHFSGSPASAEHSGATRPRGLDAPLVPGACVIDYGCGSGVLGLAAARLGAAEVHCFDIDPQALTATRANARANGIGRQLHVHERAVTLPSRADVLLANILATTLCGLSTAFAALLRPGGFVVLAGLLQPEADDVTRAYAPCFDVAPFGARDGWVCLSGRRADRQALTESHVHRLS